MWRNGEVADFLDWLRPSTRTIGDRAASRLLRPRPLQPRRLDRGGARLSRQGRPRSGAHRARALRLPDALAGRSGALRPRGALARPAGRARRRSLTQLLDLLAQRLDYHASRMARRFSTRSRTRASSRGRAVLPGDVLRRRRVRGICATSICSTRCKRLLAHRGAGAKAVVWAHNSHIGDAACTEMGRSAASSISAQLVPRPLRRRARADRLRHRPRHRRRGVATGTARWRSSGCARRGTIPMRALARCRHSGLLPRDRTGPK